MIDKFSHFNFHINYADKFLSWAKIKSKKCLQLPADKFLAKPLFNRNYSRLKNIIIIEPIYERYLQTISSRAVSALFMKHIKMINNFSIQLKTKLKADTHIKISPIREIKSEKFYHCNKIIKNFNQAIDSARIIICTYPMTTLSEAVMSKKPFIVFYPEEIYLRNNKENTTVIKALEDAKILFFDERKAAEHVNNVYFDLNNWWKSKKVIRAIKLYKKILLGDQGTNYKNLKKWKNFLT